MFALVDGTNFFVSCERVFNPELRDKPLVVLSNNDGCVIARSNEAKLLGIKMGVARFKCESLLRLYAVKVRSSNYALYADISSRMIHVLKQFASDIEVYSIDESFLYFSHKNCDFTAIGCEIKQAIQDSLGIPVGIGFGKTKTLSKLANKLAKNSGSSICNIHDYDLNKVLKTVPVESIWGVGRQFTKKLNKYLIFNAYQLAMAEPKFIRSHFHSPGEQIQFELLGQSVKKIDTEKSKNKSIISSRSFAEKVTQYHHIQAAVATNIIRAVGKLRNQALVSKHMTVYVIERLKDRKTRVLETSVTLPYESSVTQEFIKAIFLVLPSIFVEGRAYAKSGVCITGIKDEDSVQLDLFSSKKQEKDHKLNALMKSCDEVNKKYGKTLVTWACTQTSTSPWKMKQQFKSNKFTTSWDELKICK
jgi:DNA polymerase V